MLPLAQIAELERLEAEATEQLSRAARLREVSINALTTARTEGADCQKHIEACKQSLAEWHRISESFAKLEDDAISRLAELERTAATARSTIQTVRATMNQQFPDSNL
jgi:hypothetical protein